MNFLGIDENSKDLKGNTEKNNELGVAEKGSKIKSTSMLELVDLLKKTNDKFQNILASKCYNKSDYAYSIIEAFNNESFNMKRIKPLDFSDLKMKVQQAKVSYKQLTREEKKTYIQSLMELKAKQKEERNKRIEDLKMAGEKVLLFKIKSESLFAPKLDFLLPYIHEEIEMAKKCLLNKWDFPPASFFEFGNYKSKASNFPELYDDFISNSPTKNHASSVWNKELYLQIVGNHDFSLNEKNPLKRVEGDWINIDDFKNLFKKCIILHNPKFYKTQLKIDNNWYYYNNDAYEMNLECQVFYLNTGITNDNNIRYHNNKLSKDYSCYLLLFEPNIDKNFFMNDINLYIIFDLIEYNGNVLYEDVIMNSFHSSVQFDTLDYEKEYFIIIKSFLTPFGFHFSLYTDHTVESMSYNQYLKKFRNYSSYNFKVEYSPLEKNRYFLLMRNIFNISKPTKLNYSIKHTDRNLKLFFEIILINRDQIRRIYSYDYITLEPSDSPYYILMQITPPYNCPEGSVEIDLFSDVSNLVFEQINHIETYEVYDKYVPNKHGIIFKELIFAAELVYSTLFIKLRKENIIKVQNSIIDPKKKDAQIVQNVIETIEIEEKIRIFIELYKEGNLIFSTDAYNSYIFLNQIFEGIPVPQIDPKNKNQGNSIVKT